MKIIWPFPASQPKYECDLCDLPFEYTCKTCRQAMTEECYPQAQDSKRGDINESSTNT